MVDLVEDDVDDLIEVVFGSAERRWGGEGGCTVVPVREFSEAHA